MAALGLGYGGVLIATQPEPAAYIGNQISSINQVAECNIKGNISMNTGERIYHVPGQRYYQATRIDQTSGERWFCSESEAVSAGWRKSRE